MIRAATEQDIPRIVRMGRMFWAQTAYAHIPYCPDSVAYTVRAMLANELVLIGEVDGQIAGMVGAACSPFYANRSVLVAAEMFWWVEPEYRRSGVGREMLAGIEHAAKARGVSLFSMMALEVVEPEKAAAIYLKAGYRPAERTFSKDI